MFFGVPYHIYIYIRCLFVTYSNQFPNSKELCVILVGLLRRNPLSGSGSNTIYRTEWLNY